MATIKPIDRLTMYVEYTLGHEANAPTTVRNRDAWWHAFSGIASYSWTDRFNTTLRGEVFLDSQAARTFGLNSINPVRNVTLGEITLAGTYKFTKMLLGRAELRQDWANQEVFKWGPCGQ